MIEGRVSRKKHVLLIDGGAVFKGLVDRLHTCFRLRHHHDICNGLEYANRSLDLDGVVIDLMQGIVPDSSAEPSLFGLWIVEQIREFKSCASIPVAVVSHWHRDAIKESLTAKSVDCEYFYMNDIESIISYFGGATSLQ